MEVFPRADMYGVLILHRNKLRRGCGLNDTADVMRTVFGDTVHINSYNGEVAESCEIHKPSSRS